MSIWDLICEGNGKQRLSLGRVAFWLMFCVTLFHAATTAEISASIISVLGLLLTYSGFKMTSIANNIKTIVNGTKKK